VYHFVLCYSNWEAFTICYSESFESLSNGLQNALWELGGVPKCHRTDNLTSAVNKVGNPQEFTEDYDGLCRHYGVEPIFGDRITLIRFPITNLRFDRSV